MREEKAKDKEKAKTDSSVYVAFFSELTLLFKDNLLLHPNLIYSLGNKHTVCHVLHETQGKRGSYEIATCLMKNTLSVCKRGYVQEIIYISDSCGGQNSMLRNQCCTYYHMFQA